MEKQKNINYIFRIQRYIAIAIFSMCILGLIVNLTDNSRDKERLFNIVELMLFIPFAVICYIKNNNIIRVVQTILIIIVGLTAMVFNPFNSHIGELIFLVGIILFYIYDIIKLYHFWHSIIFFIIFLSAKMMINFTLLPKLIINYFVEASVAMIIVMFVLNISKIEILTYLKEIQKNEMKIRIGQNAYAVIHHFKLDAETNFINYILEDSQQGNFSKIRDYALLLKELIEKKEAMRISLLNGIISDLSYAQINQTKINIHTVFNTILDIYGLDKKIFGTVFFQKDFLSEKIYVDGVYAEIYLLFQNIIANSIESMMENKNKCHVLHIDTRNAITERTIIIEDTGIGFPKQFIDSNSIIHIDNIISTKKTGTGLGLSYIMNIIALYKGEITYINLPHGGVKIIIKLPYRSFKK